MFIVLNYGYYNAISNENITKKEKLKHLWEKINVEVYKVPLAFIDTLHEFKNLERYYSKFATKYKYLGLIINFPRNGLMNQKQKNELDNNNTKLIIEYCLFFTNDNQTFRFCWIKQNKIREKIFQVNNQEITKVLIKFFKKQRIETSKGYCTGSDVEIYGYDWEYLNRLFLSEFWCFPNKSIKITPKYYGNLDHRGIYELILKLNKLGIFTKTFGFKQEEYKFDK